MAKYDWTHTTTTAGLGLHYSYRPDGTDMSVLELPDGTYEILVIAPDGESEYLDGEIPDTTVNECIARAESVILPDEDTGI